MAIIGGIPHFQTYPCKPNDISTIWRWFIPHIPRFYGNVGDCLFLGLPHYYASQRDILEKSRMIFLRQGCHWWRLGLVPGHSEIPPICGCPALLVYKAKQLRILGFAEDDFFLCFPMGNPIFGESMADFDLFGGSLSKFKYKKPAMFLRNNNMCWHTTLQ